MTRQIPSPAPALVAAGVTSDSNERLNGWKEIAASLGKDERTVKRWSVALGLPVHRIPGSKRASVYAWSSEIQDWLRPDLTVTDDRAGLAAISTAAKTVPSRPALLLVATLCVLLAAAVGALVWNYLRPTSSMAATKQPALPSATNALYLDARYLWQKRTPATLQQAEALLLRVVDLAPGFAGARTDLATVYNLMVEYGVLPVSEGYEQSEAAAEKALALDPDNAQALTVQADIAYFGRKNYAAGLAGFESAVASDPNHGLARQWYASALMASGRFHDAAIQVEAARQLEPTSRSIQVSAAMIALGLGEFDHARSTLLQLIENEPDYRSPYRFLAFAELAVNDTKAYLNALQTRFRLTGDAPASAVVAAGLDCLSSQSSFDDCVIAMRALALDQPSTMDPYFLAHLLALSGDWSGALLQLDQTSTRHAFYYSIDPAFAAARATPDFMRGIAELNLPVVP